LKNPAPSVPKKEIGNSKVKKPLLSRGFQWYKNITCKVKPKGQKGV
jgi:hypothetical protein